MTMRRRLAAEALGTALLLAIVVGTGMMGERLADGNLAIALLANSVATGAGLIVLINCFGPVSGAHFNPAVTAACWMQRAIGWRSATLYAFSQLTGAVAGVGLAHLMFGAPVFQLSQAPRDGIGQGISEFVATFGLVGTILATQRTRPAFTPVAVGLYIIAAYWFTASTSFANPAVTLARSLTDSFAGIAPASVPLFIVAQFSGALAAVAFFSWLLREIPRDA